MQAIDVQERRARLVRRHRLSPDARARDPLAAARSVVALHATDPVTVYLSVHARTRTFAPSSLEPLLYEQRALVRLHAMRRTLWVVPRDLVPVVYAACTRAVAARERRRLEAFLAGNGIARPHAWLDRASEAALAALDELGEATASEVAETVPLLATQLRLGVGTRFETTQSAASRVLPQLGLEGRAVRARPRGSWISGQFRWSTTAAWLGREIEPLDTAPAQAELARRWLAAFGPATEADLRWWAGWTARDTRAALSSAGALEVDLDGTVGFALADDLDPVSAPAPAVALLPTLDPTTMGWKERGWYLGPHASTVFDRNGNAGPTVWWEGRVVGGWTQRPDGEIAYRVLEDVGSDAEAAIEAEAARLAEWLGDVRFSPGFLPPFQRELGGGARP